MPTQDMQATIWPTSFPYADHVIFTPTGKDLRAGTEGYTAYPIAVTGQDVEGSSRCHIPYMDCLIFSTTGKNPSLWTESNRSGSVITPSKRLETRVGIQVADLPEADERIFTAAGQGGAIRRDSDGPDAVGIALQSSEAITAADLPGTARLIVSTAGQQVASRIEGD